MSEVSTSGFDVRRTVERGLDELVRTYRFEIAVVVPLVGAVTLVAGASGVLPREIVFAPLFVLAGTLVMRLPLAAALAPLVRRSSVAALAGLCVYIYVIEYVGLTTGWPYGEFAYGVELGPMAAGVPLALPVFFVPLVCNAFLLTTLVLPSQTRRLVRVPVAVGVVLLVDLVLDPGAVALGFWTYADGGAYYGVPLSNYGGWLLSATVGVLALESSFDVGAVRNRLGDCAYALDDLVSFVLLWGVVNVAFANWLPALLVVLLAGTLVRTGRFDAPFGHRP